jgi:hypothetical protein
MVDGLFLISSPKLSEERNCYGRFAFSSIGGFTDASFAF